MNKLPKESSPKGRERFMMFLNWCTKILKTDFTRKELFFRITIDLFLSNLGLLLGILTTVGIYIYN